MIAHLGLVVSDYQKSKKFYEISLKPLGYELVMEFDKVAGLGVDKKPDFWISEGDSIKNLHVAFACESRDQVEQFYKACLEAGAKDNVTPGLREHYHPSYYGAFVLDPDGNNIEDVCHKAYPNINI